MKFRLLLLVSLVVLIWACQKEETPADSGKMEQNDIVMFKSSSAECAPGVYPLVAGQQNVIGDVEVYNTGEKLFVVFNASVPMNEFHLYVLGQTPVKRLAPGQAPFKSGIVDPAVNTFTFEIELGDLKLKTQCGDTLYLQAHAVAEGETAYGGLITKSSKGSAWYGNIGYILTCCDEPECRTETAWAEGTSYTKGGWATFTGYAFEEATVKLWAGKHHLAGTVHFSAPDSDEKVTITIHFNEGWSLQNKTEPVKVQDYEYAPSEVGGIGNFAYKTNTTSIVVPINNFYGIHADVQKCW
jgi:hypothetical protein